MTEKYIYHNSFIYCLFKITPSLRRIYLDFIEKPEKIIKVLAYYDKTPSDEEKELMDDLGSDITGMSDEHWEYEIICEVSELAFDDLKKTDYLLFARFEGY